MALWVILGVVFAVFLFSLLMDATSLRMVWLIKRKQYEAAARIAERIPLEKRSIHILINQIGAYYHGGQKEKACDLFREVEAGGTVPPQARHQWREWELALFPRRSNTH